MPQARILNSGDDINYRKKALPKDELFGSARKSACFAPGGGVLYQYYAK
jgi:hypothetical protein